MDCHRNTDTKITAKPGEPTLLLMGNPNVGKSVIFSKLTGRDVLASNYAGTTISYTYGNINDRGRSAVLIDVPGTYSLEATSEAEEVAITLLENSPDMVIGVLDATNLERNLNFALQIMQYNVPIAFALNLSDVAERQGIKIDAKALQEELGVPVIPTTAIRNIGLRDLLKQIWKSIDNPAPPPVHRNLSPDERWQEVGRIVERVQTVEHRHPTFWEKMGDWAMQPFPGIPIAILVLGLSLGLVVGGGKGLRGGLLLPLLDNYIAPFITRIVSGFVPEGIFRNVLVGEYGMLIKGIEWPFALILPYVFLFYIVLSFLEDSGYLPRLSVLVDGLLHRIGIQGGSIIPFIMGYGCAVPAILGTKACTTQKERLTISTLVCLAVPCSAQTAAFITLLGDRSIFALLIVFAISLVAIGIAGYFMNKWIPGKISPMMIEIPNLLKPDRKALTRKISIRIKHFMLEAEIPMLIGVGIAAIVAETGILNTVGDLLSPLVVGWLGLPRETSLALMLGVIRRELGVLPLLELDLTTIQLLVGSVVGLFYLPCLSVFGVLIKEFGIKIAGIISIVTLATAFFAAGLINQIYNLIILIF